jgi:nucleoside phosphorylase
MKALITFAVDSEFAPWRKLRPFARLEQPDSFRCNFGEVEVLVVFTGVGAKKPWLDIARNIWSGPIDVCISSGLAGALRDSYCVGEIIAPRAVAPISHNQKIACDSELLDLARSCGAETVPTLLTVDRVVLRAADKQELGESGDIVDMESAEVLLQAAALGVRVACVRAISDCSSEDLPLDFNRVVTHDGEVSVPRVLGELALHPSALPGLVRFGRQSHAAAEALAIFLDRYAQGLARVFAGKMPQEIAAR